MASSKIRASKNHHKDHKKSGSRSNAHKELAKVEPKNDDDDYKTRYAKFSNDLEEKQIALVEKWVSYDMDTFEGHPAYREEWDKFLVKWKKDLNQPGKELSRLNLQRLKTDWLTFWIGRRVKELWNQELRQLHQTILRTHGFDGFPDPPADRLPKEVGSVGGTDPSKSSPPVRGASAKDEGTEHKGNDDSTVGIAKDAGGAVVKKEPCSCVAEIFDFFGKHFGRKGANDEEKRATNYAHLKCCLIVLLGVLGDIESFKKHVPRYVVDRIKTLSEKAMAAQKGGGEDACLSFLCQPENVHALSTAMTFLGRCAKAGVCKGWRVERFIDVIGEFLNAKANYDSVAPSSSDTGCQAEDGEGEEEVENDDDDDVNGDNVAKSVSGGATAEGTSMTAAAASSFSSSGSGGGKPDAEMSYSFVTVHLLIRVLARKFFLQKRNCPSCWEQK